MAKIHYEASGAVSPERFIAALTDFSDRRPTLWPNLSPECYVVHEVGSTEANVQEGTLVAGSCEKNCFSAVRPPGSPSP